MPMASPARTQRRSRRHNAKNRVYTIENMRRYALCLGGACVSARYRGLAVPLDWVCAKGHSWRATPTRVYRRGVWCPGCPPLRVRSACRAGHLRPRAWCRACKAKHDLTLGDLCLHAALEGGACVTKSYRGYMIPHLWECSARHVWAAAPRAVIGLELWCPQCRPGGEAIA
jgi:hypothetical protein